MLIRAKLLSARNLERVKTLFIKRMRHNRAMAQKKGKPIPEDEYNKRLAERQDIFDKRRKKKNLTIKRNRLSKHKQAYWLYYGKMPSGAFALKSFAEKIYQFVYDDKRQTLTYICGPDHVQCVVSDENWGNLYAALEAITDYHWTQTNKKAKHVLEVDTNHYLDMQVYAKALMEMLHDKFDNIKKADCDKIDRVQTEKEKDEKKNDETNQDQSTQD